MSAPDVYRIGSEFSIINVERPFFPSSDLERQANLLWEEEIGKNANLFDGQIFNALEVSSTQLKGHWVNYRYALMVYRNPHMARELGIYPVAVNGFSVSDGHVLIARRAANVSQYPNRLEFVPSGGIDPKAGSGQAIDYRSALLSELEEETGIDRNLVRGIEPTAIIFDPLTSTWELVLSVQLAVEIGRQMNSSEYSEFTWVKLTQLSAFLDERPADDVVPLTRIIKDVVI